MAKTLGIDDISISDDVEIILDTRDENDCLTDPYRIDKIIIYFVSRDFTDTSVSEYENIQIDPELARQEKELKDLICTDPSDENVLKLKFIQNKIESSKLTSKFFFKEAVPIKTFGGFVNEETQEFYPAWLNPELVPEEVKDQVIQDNILEKVDDGKFLLRWQPFGMREGDYFLCWTWQPNIAGNSVSSHMFFNLLGDTRLTTSIPTHQTYPKKYEILMERYLPELFKAFVSEGDLTPYVLSEFNNSVAKGFTFLEDLANQIIDLLDSNSTQELFLPLLSNLFNLQLKSNDPTLWRRQIKKAIPNFKQKGTKGGLKEAFGDAGYELLKITKLWQLKSKYTYQELFNYNQSLEFNLSKNIIFPLDENNFELWYRPKNSNEWSELDSSYVSFATADAKTIMTWENNESEPVNFKLGDSIRVLYQIKEVPSSQEQQKETYTRELSLMDLRDERDQDYPPKDWNTRLIEEDDPMFNVLIPVRHPFHDPIIWGKIRTEFPYSENAYNMDEYNGSTRDSFNPCDIDKNFIDPCSDCQASKITIDVGIEELSNDRIKEAEKIVYEFAPFHSLIHSINYSGLVNEFVKSPMEEIIALMSCSNQDIVLAGEGQHIFNRAIPYNEAIEIAKRDMLSSMELVINTSNGVAKNKSIILISPSSSAEDIDNSDFKNKTGSLNFKSLGINTSTISEDPFESSNLLEVIAPADNEGFYSVSNITKNYVEISSGSVDENPLSKKQFAFRISNKMHEQSVSITQSNKFIIKNIKNDYLVNFNSVVIKITKLGETEFNTATVTEILSDGSFVVENYSSSGSVDLGFGPTSSNGQISWHPLSDDSEIFKANIDLIKEGIINFGSYDVSRTKISSDYLFYNGIQYKIKRVVGQNNLAIDYDLLDANGVNVSIYRRLFDNCVGQFDYLGLKMEAESNLEEELSIQNGANPPVETFESNNFKENYLILIDGKYYTILDIDENIMTLDGPAEDWGVVPGTDIEYVVYKFIKQPISIPDRVDPPIKGHEFNYEDDPPKGLGGFIDRSGSEVIYLNNKIYSTILNSMKTQDNITEILDQKEEINYQIEYKEEETDE